MSNAEESETVRACPNCDRAQVTPLVASGRGGVCSPDRDAQYYCNHCGEHFASVVERPAGGNVHNTRRGIARELVEANPDDLGSDGGDA